MKFYPNSSDKDLLKGCRKRNRLAQKYLYQRYASEMLGICLRYTRNKEESLEVLNGAFLKVFNAIDKYKDTGSLGGWIATIVFHSAIDFVRKKASYHKVMDFNTEADIHIHSNVLDDLVAEDLQKVIQKLSPANRSVFCLYVIDGFKHREIAEKLGISEGTSKWHLAEARKQLKTLLQDYDRTKVAV